MDRYRGGCDAGGNYVGGMGGSSPPPLSSNTYGGYGGHGNYGSHGLRDLGPDRGGGYYGSGDGRDSYGPGPVSGRGMPDADRYGDPRYEASGRSGAYSDPRYDQGGGGCAYGDPRYGQSTRSGGCGDIGYDGVSRYPPIGGYGDPRSGEPVMMDLRTGYGDPAYGASLANMAPQIDRREFFLNIIMNLDEQATAAAKNQGRKAMGRAGSMFGGLLGTIGGSRLMSDETIAQELAPQTVEQVRYALERQGWSSVVVPILLPPMPGQDKWSLVMHQGVNNSLMVFRVQLTGKLPLRHDASWHETMTSMCGDCSEQITRQPQHLSREGMNRLGMELQSDMRHMQSPISAHIQVADVREEFEVLHSFGWSRELSQQALLGARTARGGSPNRR